MKSNEQIRFCKICFKPLTIDSFNSLMDPCVCLCNKCSFKLKPIFEKFEVAGVKGIAVYEYDDVIKELLYQFKGNYDFELNHVFLGKFRRILRLRFFGYTMVFAPSHIIDDEKRGFNHVKEIFKVLSLPFVEAFVKTEQAKQTEKHFNQRREIGQAIKLANSNKLSTQKILIVDDIKTTGSTLTAMIKELKRIGTKHIRILVLSITKLENLRK